MINNCPLVEVELLGELAEFGNFEMSGFSVAEIFRGIALSSPIFDQHIYNLILNGYSFLIKINGEPLTKPFDDVTLFNKLDGNKITISTMVEVQGDALGIVTGIALIGLAFTGVGLFGIGAVTWGLMGASLVFSSIFKTPKTNVKNKDEEKNTKRSVNFTGVINVVGSGASVPLTFGQVWTGSIVASASVYPSIRPVT